MKRGRPPGGFRLRPKLVVGAAVRFRTYTKREGIDKTDRSWLAQGKIEKRANHGFFWITVTDPEYLNVAERVKRGSDDIYYPE